ncbi:MAG: nucleotidyltransferase family protein [Dehalobacter sp.]|nr:nucleotidyltransferase family protein [Dehalobacter sp.]
MEISVNSNYHDPSDLRLIDDVNVLHADNVLCAVSSDTVDITGDKLLFILSVLRKEPVKLPTLSADEWKDLLYFLDIHGILPYFYKQLTARPTPLMLPPPEAMGSMRRNYLQTASKSVVVEKVVKNVMSAFKKEGIDVLLLKGPAFAVYLYNNPGVRPYSDIDLLVYPEDVPRSCEVLKGLGYLYSETIACSLEEKRINQEAFIPGDSRSGPCIELHWNYQPFSMMNEQADMKPVFERAITVKMADVSFKTMHPADALCFAASHLIYQHDKGLRLIWILDIALLCEHLESPRDWELAKKLSVENLSRVALEKSIQMARLWTDLRIPEDVDDFSRWPKALKRETHFYAYQKTRNPISGFRLALSGDGKNGSIVSRMLKHAFPSSEFMRKRYPELKRWPLLVSYFRHWVYWLTHK